MCKTQVPSPTQQNKKKRKEIKDMSKKIWKGRTRRL
jgi:hypothetical protein